MPAMRGRRLVRRPRPLFRVAGGGSGGTRRLSAELQPTDISFLAAGLGTGAVAQRVEGVMAHAADRGGLGEVDFHVVTLGVCGLQDASPLVNVHMNVRILYHIHILCQ